VETVQSTVLSTNRARERGDDGGVSPVHIAQRERSEREIWERAQAARFGLSTSPNIRRERLSHKGTEHKNSETRFHLHARREGAGADKAVLVGTTAAAAEAENR
jgi:hypothetical protein